MKAVVAAFNQEKALVEAFSVITNLRMQLFEALVEVGLELRTRGAVVLHKVLTARDAEEGGELRQFLSSLAQEQSGNEFLLTWARAFDWGVQVSIFSRTRC